MLRPVRIRIGLVVLTSLLVLKFAGVAAAAPTITSLSPTSSAVGASVTITGSGFGSTQGSSTVKFNSTTATSITSWNSTNIVAIVPTGATTGNVVVTVSSVASNGKSFTVLATPAITSLSTTSGGVGTSVTITGSGFGATRGSSTVKFNGTTVATYTSWSATSIVVVVPAGATTGNVVVHASGVDSNGQSFTVIPAPAITNLSPASGSVGDSVTINGTHFGASQGSSTVKFNGTAAMSTSWSDTSIVTTVPTGATTGNVVVTTAGGASPGVSFTVIATPNITSLSPTSGAVGAAVTINGTNFQPTQGSSTVTFNGVPASTITSWSATQIKTIVPSGATTGNVVVTAFGLASNGRSFTVKPTPVITGLSPAIGAIGMRVTITGVNFGSTQGSSTVRFNGTAATPASWSAGQIVVPVPTGATTGNVVVHTSGVDTNGAAFTVSVLTSLAISPQGLSVPINSQQRLAAIGTFASGDTQNLGSNVTWTSDTTTATVDSTGLVTLSDEGDETIHAAVGSQSATTTITVTRSSFIRMGRMNRPRETATLLTTGQVLFVGGEGGDASVAPTAELYDPASGSFAYTGNPHTIRRAFTATRLQNGKVLIIGGYRIASSTQQTLSSAELYDPVAGSFAFTGGLNTGRSSHAATLLPDGRVLISGGVGSSFERVAASEIYDPAAGTFTVSGDLVTPRAFHASTLLADGTVFISGGFSDTNVLTLEAYDPATGTFTTTATASTSLLGPTLLSSGAVFFAMGTNSGTGAPTTLYDLVAHTLSPSGSFNLDRADNTATRLSDGTVLVVGGLAGTDQTGTAELYDPATQSFTAAGSTAFVRHDHLSTLLSDGTVLITGGDTLTAELYAPTPPAPASLRITPSSVTLAVGEQAQFSAIDNHGYPRADATWAVSDPALATLSSEAMPTLTAVAAGTVSLTATIGSVSATAQVTLSTSTTTHDPGTAYWSLPVPAGATFKQVVQAAGPGGPALFAISDVGQQSVVQALTVDGQQLWETWLPTVNPNSVADGSGGLIVTTTSSCSPGGYLWIMDLDGATGEGRWGFSSLSTCTVTPPEIAVRHDGVLFITAPGNTSGFPEVMRVDANTGEQLAAPTIPQSSFDDITGHTSFGYSRVGPPVVDADGVTYLEYETRHVAYPPQVTSATLWLMRIDPITGLATTQLTTTNADVNLFPGRILPDNHGGVVATWTYRPSSPPDDPNPLRAAHVDAAGTVLDFTLAIQPAVVLIGTDGLPVNLSLLLGENDAAFASYGSSLQSFNVLTGASNWTYSAASQSIGVVTTDNVGGVAAKVTDSNGVDTVVTFDAAGNLTTSALTGIGLNHDAGAFWVGGGDSEAVVTYAGPFVELSTTGFARLSNEESETQKPNMIVTPDTAADPPGQDAIGDILTLLQSKLQAEAAGPNPTCSSWLTHPTIAGRTWSDYLNVYVTTNPQTPNNRWYGHGVIRFDNNPNVLDETTVAARNGDNPTRSKPTGIPEGWFIVVNNISGYYKLQASNGGRFESRTRHYPGASPRYRAETLLHELGHTLVPTTDMPPALKQFGMLPDLMNEAAQKANAKLVDSKCRALIEQFPK